MNLSDLISTLAAVDGALPVTLDGESGLAVISWRGDYYQPSVTHGRSSFAATSAVNTEYGFSFREPTSYLKFDPAETVTDLLAILRAVLDGAGLNGYKGGVYEAAQDATVWADESGTCPGRAVSDIKETDGTIALLTVEQGW